LISRRTTINATARITGTHSQGTAIEKAAFGSTSQKRMKPPAPTTIAETMPTQNPGPSATSRNVDRFSRKLAMDRSSESLERCYKSSHVPGAFFPFPFVAFQPRGQLGDVRRYASSFVKRQPLGSFSIALIGVTVHIGDRLSVRNR